MVIASDNVRFYEKYKHQLLATLAVNIIAVSHGHAIAWLAPALILLQSDNSPLESGKITVEEASWIGALVCFGGIIGNFIFGILLNKIGRKKTMYLLVVPHTIFWTTLIFGVTVMHLFIARTLSGLTGGGVFVVIPSYLADISDNKIRGLLSSAFTVFLNVGMLSGFILGSHLSYSLFPRVIVGLSILFIIAIYRLPDTPQYLIKIKKEDEAENALRFYRNYKGVTKEEFQEFNELFSNLKKSIRGGDSKESRKLTLEDFRQPQAIKGISIGIALMVLNQFSGYYALVSYTSSIFQQSGSNLDPNTCTIIVGVIQLFGTCIAANLVDRIGRKLLLMISAGGMTIGLSALGLYSYLSLAQDLTHFSWVAVASMSFAVLLASFGVLPLPIVLLAEILPQKVKAVASTFIMCLLSFLAFIVLKVFPVMMVSFGIHGTMWVCAGCTIAGGIFVWLFLPETKGKCLEKTDDT